MVTSPINLQERIDRIAEDCRQVFVLQADERIVAAFLYGSALTVNWRSDSDLDVAVLDLPETPLSWADEAFLMDSLEKATGLQIDLRFLRDCSASHQLHILKNGLSIWNQDSRLMGIYTQSVEEKILKNKEAVNLDWATTVGRFIHSSESSE